MQDEFSRISRAFRGIIFALVLMVYGPVWAGDADGKDAGAPAALTLEEALGRALDNNPALAVYAEEVRAREAETLEAGLRPNPVLALEAENLFGSGDYSSAGLSETTVTINQEVELGGKRSRRRELAEAETAVAVSDFHLARNDVLAGTEKAFIAVLAAQQRLELADELTELAARVLAAVEERVAAGGAAAAEEIRARIHLREMKTLREKGRRSLAAARHSLAAFMGQEEADFQHVAGDLKAVHYLPEPAELERLVAQSPEVVRQKAEVDTRLRSVKLEQARQYPDPEIGVGARYLAENEDTALVLGVSVPLPVFNRNQNAIAAARSRLAKAGEEERNALILTKSAVNAAWQEMHAALAEAEALQKEIIPASRQALAATEYGYQAGKFPILEVLDAQRVMVEAREGYLDALVSYHQAFIEIKRLLGGLPDDDDGTLPVFKE